MVKKKIKTVKRYSPTATYNDILITLDLIYGV